MIRSRARIADGMIAAGMLLVCCGLVRESGAAIANVQLSGDFSSVVVAVADFQISPDGSRIVYRADQDRDNVFELYSAPLSGGTPVKLNGALTPDGDVEPDYQVSADSATVVYRADQDADNVYELYSASIGGGAVVKLNGALAAGGDVTNFLLGGDGARAVYRADQDADDVYELYSVPLGGGGAAVKLNGALATGGDVDYNYISITPDSARVVYRADQDTDNVNELYSAPIGGGTATKLNGGLPAGGSVFEFKIGPDSATVVYRADQDTDNVYELYSVPVGGGARTKLNGALVAGGDMTYDYQVSPDGATVVYLADQDTDNVNELYRVPIGGGAATKLNGALVPSGRVYDFKISPDGARVVYRANQESLTQLDLYSAPMSGGAPTRLSGALVSDRFVQDQYQVSGDSARVVYRADQDTDEVYELYSVPTGGGAVTKLNGALVSGGDVSYGFMPSGDSARVVYWADQDTDEVYELYSAPIGGGTVTKLNGALTAGGSVYSVFRISPDSSVVVYRADRELDELHELYQAPIGGGASIKLNVTLARGGDVVNFEIDPTGVRAVYYADYDQNAVFELYSVPLDGGAVTKLSGALVSTEGVPLFQLGGAGARVVYRADLETSDVLELYSQPIAGGPRTKLNGALVAGGDVGVYRIGPDGARVVYSADLDADNLPELYSVPIGGGASTKLNGALGAGGSVGNDFIVTPDNSRVVYRAKLDSSQPVELFSVPLGGGTVTKLNGALVFQGDVTEFRVSPDSSRVIYLADQDTHDIWELYCVPIGGGAAIKLNGALTAGGDVHDQFEPSPDGTRVVYWADQDTNDVHELYSVPIGGGAAIKLNAPMVAGGYVLDNGFQISPDGARVVYWADQDTNDVNELYSVPLAGGAVTKLSGALVAGGDVQSYFIISPDSARVLYRADGDTDEMWELYSAPLGGGAVVKLNGPLVAGGDIYEYAISPDSARAVYRGIQDAAGVVELYSVPLGGGTPTKLNGALAPDGDVQSWFAIGPDSFHNLYRADQNTNGNQLFTSFEDSLIYVDADAPGANDGSSWHDAFHHLQDALLAATSPAGVIYEMRMAEGTYLPDRGAGINPGYRGASFTLHHGLTLKGGYAGWGAADPDARDAATHVTTLSGDLLGDDAGDMFDASRDENSFHVAIVLAAATVDGITIAGGNADAHYSIDTSGYAGMGGGMACAHGSQPTLVDCTFRENAATAHSGWGGGLAGHNATLTGCVFRDNLAGLGGGMNGTAWMLLDCTFINNSATVHGGGLDLGGSLGGSTILNGCAFYGNTAAINGGGIYSLDTSEGPTLVNCVFSGNAAGYFGGGFFSDETDLNRPPLINCTFSANSAGQQGGGAYFADSPGVLSNCVFWGNTDSGTNVEAAQVTAQGQPVTFSHCCLQGWSGSLGGAGNIGDNPLFADAAGSDGQPGTPDDDLSLAGGSPCIDAGVNAAALGLVTEDFAGNPRFVDDPATPDTGAGTPPIIDLGAYEFAGGAGEIIYVDADAPGANDGSSWHNAFTELSAALSVAASGAEIRVAQGVYVPAGTARTVTFALVDGVALRGGYAGFGTSAPNARDVAAFETVLSGDLLGDDAHEFINRGDNFYHVVSALGVGATAVLDGFTISGGNADSPGVSDNSGGGMYCDSSPTVIACSFIENQAISGGGMYCGPTSFVGYPTLIDCAFYHNSAQDGGAMFITDSDPTMTGCAFIGNKASMYGGALNFYMDSFPTLTDCTFSRNTCSEEGGAIYALFTFNMTLNHCTFSDNIGSFKGGGLRITNDSANCQIDSCVFWGNAGGGGTVESAQIDSDIVLAINHTCVMGLTGALGGAGNIGDDPRFAGFGMTGDIFVDETYAGPADGSAAHPYPTVTQILGVRQNYGYSLGLAAGSPCSGAGAGSSNMGAPHGTGGVGGGPVTLRVAAGDYSLALCSFYYHVSLLGAGVDHTALLGTVHSLRENTRLEDVLITGGPHWGVNLDVAETMAIRNCRITGNAPSYSTGYSYAGGINCAAFSSPTIVNCRINDNQGQGITCNYGCAARIEGCFLVSNSGRGIRSEGSSDARIVDCTIVDNLDGGIFVGPYSTTEIHGCTIIDNFARAVGGGIQCWYSSPLISRCSITHNDAPEGGGIYSGWRSQPNIVNCLIADNRSATNGGGLFCWQYSGADLVNCTLANNTALLGNGVAIDSPLHAQPGAVNIANSILWNGGDEVWIGDQSTVDIEFSAVTGGWLGAGNIPDDPQFAAGSENYRPTAGSPCIDAGDYAAVPPGLVTDLDANPRISNGIVDMGAYERPFDQTPLEAELRVTPRTLNLKSRGQWVTCWIELPPGNNPADIDVASLLLNGVVPAGNEPTVIGDDDGDGAPDLMVKFPRQELIAILEVGEAVEITVTGSAAGRSFVGVDCIRVINPCIGHQRIRLRHRLFFNILILLDYLDEQLPPLEGAPFAGVLSAPPEGLTLAAANLPPGAKLDPVTGWFTWEPQPGQLGVHHNITFTVTTADDELAESITISVEEIAARAGPNWRLYR